MLLAIRNELVGYHAIKALLGRQGDEFFRQRDVLFAGKTESVNDPACFVFGLLDTLADLHLLVPREQGDLAHLPQVHAHRVVQEVDSVLLCFIVRPRPRAPLHLGGIDHVNVQAAELGEHLVEICGGGECLP